MRTRTFLYVLAGLLVATVALPSATFAATILQLSDSSSDETMASDLSALVVFETSGSVMTATVTNQTQTTTSGYNMNELYFGVTGDVTDLMLTGSSGSMDGDNLADWTLYPEGRGNSVVTQADGFGTFDWALKDGVNGDAATVHPYEIQVFTFSFTCAAAAVCDSADFGTVLSSKGAAHGHQLVAAKFVTGPADDSAFGATATIVPEPSPAALLGLGIAILALRRRRTH
jgi:hypothetical protein